jgi:hypothetical protein
MKAWGTQFHEGSAVKCHLQKMFLLGLELNYSAGSGDNYLRTLAEANEGRKISVS